MSKVRLPFLCFLILLSMIGSFVPRTKAQTQNTGAIQGRVFEAGSLAPVPGAAVTVTHEDLGLERTTVTNADGIYFVGILPSGTYKITATRTGYENDTNPDNSIIRNFLIHITNTEKADQPPPIVLRKASTTAPQPPVTPPVTPPTKPPVATTPPATTPPATTPSTNPPATTQESEAELLTNTTNATRGQSFGEHQLLSLPLPGVRTFDDLAFLAPGVAPPPLAIGKSVGPGIGSGVGTSGQFAVNGLRSRSNNFTIDGSNDNDEEVGVRRQGFTSLVPQSIESVQEFQITTLLPEPQYGRNMGAQVNAVSRSGGANFHGTVYGFLTKDSLRARDPFDFVQSGTKSNLVSNGQTVLLNGAPLQVSNFAPKEPAYTRGQYGFVFGGPVISRQTHFFVSYEHQDIDASQTAHFAVPTVADRGIFQTGDKGFVRNGVSLFPTTDIGDAFFSLFPFPNNPNGPYGGNTFTEVLPASADGSILSGKLDHNLRAFGRDHSLTGRYNFTDDNTILPVTGDALFSSLRALVRTQDLAFSLNSALSTEAANQFRFSWGRTSLGFQEVRDSFLIPSGKFPLLPFLLNAPLVRNLTLPGLPPTFSSPSGVDSESSLGVDKSGNATGTGPIGQVIVSGYSPIGVDVFTFPQTRANNIFQYADTFIYNLRKHRFTAGVDIRRSQLNSSIDRNSRPLAVFSAAADIGTLVKQGQLLTNTLANLGSIPGFYLGKDFVAAGAPTGFYQTLTTVSDPTIRLRFWQHDFFIADQIRLASNLTLTLGLRYELNTVPTEADRRIESTFSAPQIQEFENIEKKISVDGVFPGSGLETFLAGRSKIYKEDKNNFAPHIAFAWDPFGNGKTSIRAGYGIYYDQILGAVVSQSRSVFPSFLPTNLAGFVQGLNTTNQFSHPLAATNPQQFAIPGTLNTFNPSSSLASGPFSPVINFYINSAAFTDFATGPAFVLPAANLQTPYAQHWGLTVEHQFGRDLLVSAAYVGTRGVHLLRASTPNLGLNTTPVVGQLVPNGSAPQFIGFNFPPNQNGKTLRPFPLLGSITIIDSDANSIYHALQLQSIKRFSHGLQFTAAYTWSHAIDEVSDIFDLEGAKALSQNSLDRRAERGSANFDVRHRFVFSAIWDLPSRKDSFFLDGWQLASIGSFQTGQPYSLLFCCDNNLDGNLTDRVGLNFSNPGSTPRNIFRAPGIQTVDLAINKRFKFGERQKLEFRTELFNLFNHENFGIPIHQLFFGNVGGSPALGQKHFVDTRVPMFTAQFALKYSF